jgi:hypothetical protein
MVTWVRDYEFGSDNSKIRGDGCVDALCIAVESFDAVPVSIKALLNNF